MVPDIKYNNLEKPETRIALIKTGLSEKEIGKAYQIMHGRQVI